MSEEKVVNNGCPRLSRLSVHKYGLDDPTIQDKLGIKVQGDTSNIADEFVKRCGS